MKRLNVNLSPKTTRIPVVRTVITNVSRHLLFIVRITINPTNPSTPIVATGMPILPSHKRKP